MSKKKSEKSKIKNNYSIATSAKFSCSNRSVNVTNMYVHAA